MILAIEQGNTNTLFAVHDGQDWIAQWRSATEASRALARAEVVGKQAEHLQRNDIGAPGHAAGPVGSQPARGNARHVRAVHAQAAPARCGRARRDAGGHPARA